MFKTARFIIIFLYCLLFIVHCSLAQDYPTFYGEEVVVTALRIPRLASTIPWETEVITRQEIADSSAFKLGDLLRQVAGLSVKANGGLSSQISARVRGSSSQQVLVLLNGSRINSPSLGMFDLGDVLLTDVEKIEIVKAPLSAIYGADAIGGVINVITGQVSQDAQLEVAASYGEFSTQNLSVRGAGPHYFFAATSLYTAGFRPNSDYLAQDYHVQFSGQAGPAYLEAGAKRYNADKGSPGSLDFLTPLARQTDQNHFYDLTYRADQIGLKITLAQAILDQKYENPAWAILSTHKTITNNFNVQEALTLPQNNSLVFGLETREDNSQSVNSGGRLLSNRAVYLQHEMSLSETAKLVWSGREDLSPAYGDHFNPRLGLVFGLVNDALLKVSWGTSFKAPTIDDLYWTKLTEPGWPTGVITTEGNPALNAETAQGLDVSLEYGLARFSLYLNDITDMIRWRNTSTSTVDAYWTPVNVGRVGIQGFELALKQQLTETLRGGLNFTYQIAKDKGSNTFLDYAPQASYNVGLDYHNASGLNADLNLRYVGERYTDLLNSNTLPAYTIADLTVFRDYHDLRLKLDIDNIFNQSYAESYGFADVYPMPGRRYNIGVTYKL